MTNRREFLQITTASSALPLLARSRKSMSAIPGNTDRVLDYYKVIADQRHAQSLAMASRSEELGKPAHILVNGDVTRFWTSELEDVWKQVAVPVAGLTEYGPMFCLEQLCHQFGMRLVYKGQHTINPNGMVEHELSGPQSLLQSASREFIKTDNESWGGKLAGLMSEIPLGQTSMEKMRVSSAAKGDKLHEDIVMLYSWIIAPARTVKQES